MNHQIDLDNLSVKETKLLTKISDAFIKEYHKLLENLSSTQQENPVWLFSSILSRNPNSSPLFTQCMRIAFLTHALKENPHIQTIKLADKHLAKVLSAHFRKTHPHLKILTNNRFHEKIKNASFFLYQFAKALFYVLSRFFASRKYLFTSKKHPPHKTLSLIGTFILNKKNQGGIVNHQYKDRYFPGLFQAISSKNNEHTTFYLPTFYKFKNYFKAFSLTRKASPPFIIQDDFLKWQDYALALKYSFYSPFLKLPQKISFYSINILPLVRKELRQNAFSYSSILAYLNYRFAYRLSKHNYNIKEVTLWYENQTWDHGLIWGIRKYFPQTPTNAYYGIFLSTTHNACAFPTSLENQLKLLPHFFYAIGDSLHTHLKTYCNSLKVITAPAFRFSTTLLTLHTPPPPPFTILIALPIELNTSKILLNTVNALAKVFHEKPITFIIKPHPAHLKKTLIFFKKNLSIYQNLSICQNPFYLSLKKSHLLISLSSSTCIETALCGKPVLIFHPPGSLPQNPFPENFPTCLWQTCYSLEEFSNAINHFSHNFKTKQEYLQTLSNKIKKNYLTPTTSKTLNHWLNARYYDFLPKQNPS